MMKNVDDEFEITIIEAKELVAMEYLNIKRKRPLMIEKIDEYIEANTIKVNELIGIECLTINKKILQYILNKNLIWKKLESLEKNIFTSEDFDNSFPDEIIIVYMSTDGDISKLVCSFYNHENSIQLDYNDMCSTIHHKGFSGVYIGNTSGENAALDATKIAIKYTEHKKIQSIIDGAMGILIIFETHSDYPIHDIGEAMNLVESRANSDADVIFGTQCNEDLAMDKVRVIVVVSGLTS